jgi:methyltransferase family protein
VLNVDPYSKGNVYRARRFALLKGVLDDVLARQPKCRVIDIGGNAQYWQTFGQDLDWNRIEVTLVNLEKEEAGHPRITSVVGDARDLREFPDLSFDVVYSNSVIEHVGLWRDMVRMANEVKRLAPRYFIQTPYYWFPVEAHARVPFIHWLPEPIRVRMVMRRNCGYWPKQSDIGSATSMVQSAILLDKSQMRFLFPDAEIVSEKALGLTKSLIAIK